MKLELPDNAKEALQFLVLGALAIVALRLLYAGALHALAPDASDGIGTMVAPYRSGYLLHDQHTIVLGGKGLFVRIAVGALFTVASGAVLALLGAIIAKALGGNSQRTAVRSARAGLAVAALYVVVSAFALPPRSIVISKHALILHDRASLMDVLGAPWPCAVDTIALEIVTGIEVREIARSFGACGSDAHVTVTTTMGRVIDVPPPAGAASCEEARAHADGLAGVIRSHTLTNSAH